MNSALSYPEWWRGRPEEARQPVVNCLVPIPAAMVSLADESESEVRRLLAHEVLSFFARCEIVSALVTMPRRGAEPPSDEHVACVTVSDSTLGLVESAAG